MLIRQFRSSYYLQYVLLIVLSAALWARPFISGCVVPPATDDSPLFQLILNWLPDWVFISPLLGFILLLLEAFYLNYVLIKHEIASRNSLITAFVYIIIMSQSLPALSLNPVLCAAFFIIPALDQILSTYGMPDPTKDVFSAAFLLALASLFHFSGIFIFILLLVSFMIFGTFSIRIVFVSLSGLVSVYLYLFLYYFLTDKLEGQWCMFIKWFSDIPQLHLAPGLLQYIVWGMMVSFFLDAFFHIAIRMREWNIRIRKVILLNIYFVFIAIISMVYLWDNLELAVMMMGIPFTIFISGYLAVKRKNTMFLEIYLIAWLIMVFINNLMMAEC